MDKKDQKKQYTKPSLNELGNLVQKTQNNSVASFCDKHGGQKTGNSNCK